MIYNKYMEFHTIQKNNRGYYIKNMAKRSGKNKYFKTFIGAMNWANTQGIILTRVR